MATSDFITRSEIRSIFGTTFYNRGKSYYEQGMIASLQPDNADPQKWVAKVRGKRRTYSVTVSFVGDRLHAGCTCPAFETYDGCKHVVAALLALNHLNDESSSHRQSAVQTHGQLAATTAEDTQVPAKPTSSRDTSNEKRQLADRSYATSRKLIHLFQTTASQRDDTASLADTKRQDLQVEWICHPISSHREFIGLAMKVGPKKTYVVRKIRDFLSAVIRTRSYVFTPKFTYMPESHRFGEIDHEILRILIDVFQSETSYRDLFGYREMYGLMDKDRTVWIPPKTWATLFPLLLQANTTVDTYGHVGSIETDDAPPVTARIRQQNDGDYSLQFAGISDLHALPSYGCAYRGTTFYAMEPTMLAQLAEIKRMVSSEKRADIAIPPEALPTVVNEVLPQLKRALRVDMDKRIAKRIIEAPLQAKVYLDWWNKDEDDTDGALAAHLEFVYGDVTIDPLVVENSVDLETTDTIVVRDVAAERQILHLLEDAAFIRGNGELLLFDEGAVYAFLFHRLPEVQALAEVFAKSTVDARTKPVARPRSRIELDEKTNWLEVSFDIAGLHPSEIREVLNSLMEKKKYHRLRDGAFISFEDGAYAELAAVVGDLSLGRADLRGNKRSAATEQLDSGLSLRLPALRALPLMDAQAGSSVRFGKSLRQWLDNLRHPDNIDAPVPEGLRATLRDYQSFGFQWLKTLAQYGFGGILADDMGLGKTIQAITFLLSDKADMAKLEDSAAGAAAGAAMESVTGSTGQKTSLIVCPSSLTYNWLHELETFAPSLRAAVVSGNSEERQRILESAEAFDVLVTSYPLLRRDADAYAGRPFRTLILDEAQAIKNHGTQTAQATRDIASDIRFALTGTPIENSLDDLWSIFHTLFPELLGSHKSFASLLPETVAKRVRPFILRRLKQDVLTELPEKIETLQTSELTSEQKKLYLAYLTRLQQETVQELATEGFQKGRLRILAGLTRLRQICCHPSLCVEDYRGQSGKLEQLMELVQEYMAANQRMLIFSQFTSMLQILRQVLANQGIEHFYLDGDTPVKDRLSLCQSFNEGTAPIFLISLKAGGTGLNLTGADTVILYDLWWNPAVEEQAADRAHRMGQKRTVQVIRMVTRGTIEEKIHDLQKRKRDLIDTVVQAGSEGLSTLTEADVRELLMI